MAHFHLTPARCNIEAFLYKESLHENRFSTIRRFLSRVQRSIGNLSEHRDRYLVRTDSHLLAPMEHEAMTITEGL